MPPHGVQGQAQVLAGLGVVRGDFQRPAELLFRLEEPVQPAERPAEVVVDDRVAGIKPDALPVGVFGLPEPLLAVQFVPLHGVLGRLRVLAKPTTGRMAYHWDARDSRARRSTRTRRMARGNRTRLYRPGGDRDRRLVGNELRPRPRIPVRLGSRARPGRARCQARTVARPPGAGPPGRPGGPE